VTQPGTQRVGFLCSHLHKGGMQHAISRLSRALPGDITQYVLFFGSEGAAFTYQATLVDLDVAGSLSSGTLQKAVNFVRRRQRLQEAIRRLKLDTLVSFGESAHLYNCLTSGKRTVLSTRVSVDEWLRQLGAAARPYRFVLRRLYARADAVIAVSEAIADSLRTSFGVPATRLRTIYNGYDAAEITRLAEAPLSPEDERWFVESPVPDSLVVVAVGALVPQKGHDILLHAFARVRQSMPGARLLIVGDGPDRAALEAAARQLGVADAVRFAGYQPNPYAFMRRAAVFALASRFEGFPNVLVEAMICGVPVVAMDCETGPREILGSAPSAGVLVPMTPGVPADRAAGPLADALLSVLTSPTRRSALAAGARERAAAFGMEPFVAAWVREL
jgi:glycosyltransferase involved in cell wall biosynthesis